MKKKLNGPVIYLNPKTLDITCNPSLCKEKLKSYFEIKETNYKWAGGPVLHRFYFSICSECSTRSITTLNKKLTDQSYKAAIKNLGIDPSLTEEELNEKKKYRKEN